MPAYRTELVNVVSGVNRRTRPGRTRHGRRGIECEPVRTAFVSNHGRRAGGYSYHEASCGERRIVCRISARKQRAFRYWRRLLVVARTSSENTGQDVTA